MKNKQYYNGMQSPFTKISMKFTFPLRELDDEFNFIKFQQLKINALLPPDETKSPISSYSLLFSHTMYSTVA